MAKGFKDMMSERMEKSAGMTHSMKGAGGKMARMGRGKSGGKMKSPKGKR